MRQYFACRAKGFASLAQKQTGVHCLTSKDGKFDCSPHAVPTCSEVAVFDHKHITQVTHESAADEAAFYVFSACS